MIKACDKTHSLAVAVLNFEKEFNVGGVIRTANAAAVREVIIVGRKNWNKSAATGAHTRTKIYHIPTIDEFLVHVISCGYSIVSLEIDERAEDIFSCQYSPNPIIVIGNEGKGIPEKILEKSSKIIRIPQFGQVECLNAAASAAIAIYDWIRKNADSSSSCKIKGRKYQTTYKTANMRK